MPPDNPSALQLPEGSILPVKRAVRLPISRYQRPPANTDPCGFLCPTIPPASTDLCRFQYPTTQAANRKMEQRHSNAALQYGATIHAEMIPVDSTPPCYNENAEYYSGFTLVAR